MDTDKLLARALECVERSEIHLTAAAGAAQVYALLAIANELKRANDAREGAAELAATIDLYKQ